MGELSVKSKTALIKAGTLTGLRSPFGKKDASTGAPMQIEGIAGEWTNFDRTHSIPCSSHSIDKYPECAEINIRRLFNVYLTSSVRIINKDEYTGLINCHGVTKATENAVALTNTIERSLKFATLERVGLLNSSKAIHEYKKIEELQYSFDGAILDITI